MDAENVEISMCGILIYEHTFLVLNTNKVKNRGKTLNKTEEKRFVGKFRLKCGFSGSKPVSSFSVFSPFR